MYLLSPKNAIPLSTARLDRSTQAVILGAHRPPASTTTTHEASVIAPTVTNAKTRAEFSLEVRLPDAEAGDASRIVRYCDVCRRWGQRGSVHLCGRNWHRHLGELLAAIASGGAR